MTLLYRQQVRKAVGNIAFGPLHMIALEDQPKVFCPDQKDNAARLIGGCQKIPRRIVAVQRLDQDRQTVWLGHGGSETQVFNECRMGTRPDGKSRHDMDIWRADQDRIVQRLPASPRTAWPIAASPGLK